MINVLIVDDEYYAREGVKHIIETHGGDRFQVIAEAADSFSALEMIRSRRPHLVLADIQMPMMDGLELVQAASKYTSKFIIITGHDQFSYAKQAFKLDVVDFILKPVDPQELIAAMDRATAYHQWDNSSVKKRILEYLRKESIDLSALSHVPWENLRLALFQLESNAAYGMKYGDFLSLQKELVKRMETYTNVPCCAIEVYTDRIVVLLNGGEDHVPRLLALQQEFQEQEGLSLCIALSDSVRQNDLPKAYDHVRTLMTDRFYHKNREVIQRLHPEGDEVKTEEVERLIDGIRLSVQAGDQQQSTEKVKELYRFFLLRKCRFEMILEAAMILYQSIRNLLMAEGISFQELEAYSPVNYSISLRQMLLGTLLLVEKGMLLLRENRSEMWDSAVSKAIAIMNSRFCEDLTLDTLAKEVFLNKSYLSRKIKEKLGMNYSKYIAKLRMEKALELLRDNHNVEDVAKQVGYSNYRYFSDVFKQYTGHPPSRYKKQG